MISTNEAIIAVGIAVLGIVALWVRALNQRKREAHYYQQGLELAKAGDRLGALRSFVAAEANWMFNSSSDQMQRDLERLGGIVRNISEQMAALGSAVDTNEAEKHIAQLSELSGNIEAVAGSARPVELLRAIIESSKQLEKSRKDLRARCNEFLSTQARV